MSPTCLARCTQRTGSVASTGLGSTVRLQTRPTTDIEQFDHLRITSGDETVAVLEGPTRNKVKHIEPQLGDGQQLVTSDDTCTSYCKSNCTCTECVYGCSNCCDPSTGTCSGCDDDGGGGGPCSPAGCAEP